MAAQPSNTAFLDGRFCKASQRRVCAATQIFVVGDVLHPLDGLAVQSFLNSDMGHCGRCRCAMPMPVTWWAPDDVARPDFFDRTTFTLRPADAGSDDQSLTERMLVPGRASPGLERHDGSADSRRPLSLEQPVDADVAREPLCGSLGR